MNITTTLRRVALFISCCLFSITVIRAGIIFDGSLGTNAPPATLGSYNMTPFPMDFRPLFIDVDDVDVPSICPNDLLFSESANHRIIGAGWASWSHGYTGDVYFFEGQSVTITLPPGTNAFYCYVEPNVFNVFTVEATANDGTTSGLIPVNGAGGASGFGFYTSGPCMLTTITITLGQGSGGFGLGEFGINVTCCDENLSPACKNINVSLAADCQVTITPQMVLTGGDYCFADYVVNLSTYGVPVPNPIDSHYLGTHIIASVQNIVTGNSCWSDLNVEDKLAPTAVCRADTTDCYLFEVDFPLNYSGTDCSAFTVKTIGERTDHFDCDEVYLKAVYRDILITDASGNSTQCTDTILVERIRAVDIILPELPVTLNCAVAYLLDENGHPSPYITGFPSVLLSNGQLLNIWPLNILLGCNLLITYEDIDLGEIGCVRKIMRSWTVREWWCNTEIVRTVIQLIIIRDDFGPVITHAPYGFDATTGIKNCQAKVLLPSIEAYDVCHNKVRVDISYPGGVLINQNGGYVILPVGEDTIFYRLYDACYNLTEYWIIVHVRDETEPVAVCDRNTVVSLNHPGISWVPAGVFDDGSFDECALHHFEVRRMDNDFCGTVGADDWGPEVGFCCEDVGKFIMVAFKAIDVSGNEAICMVRVEVQDKDRPILTCLPDITIDCRFAIDFNRLDDVFGKIAVDSASRDTIIIDPRYYHIIGGHPFDGLASDNCPPTMVETIDTTNINHCGLGYIVRIFQASDRQGNLSDYCRQVITIINRDTFDFNDIVWPWDLDTTGICNPDDLVPERLIAPYNKPTTNDDHCSLIGYSYDDQIFSPTIPGDPCFKIIRTWKVIDWCQRDYAGNVIIWSHDQVIKVRNLIDPIITRVTRDTVICSYDIDCRPVKTSFSITASDDCTPANQMLYTYKIDLFSDGTIDVFRAGVGENVAQGTWPIGKHIVKWEVEDRCGNTAKTSFILDIRNCKPPVAYCLNGLATNLTPMDINGDGIPDVARDTIWAKDFDAGSFHNCGYRVNLSFSADTNNIYRVYDCDSIGSRSVELWVTDVNGNTSFCRTFIDIQDNLGFCPLTIHSANVIGLVETERKDRVQNVTVELSNSGVNDVKTDANGQYAFIQIPAGQSVVVRPSKTDGWMNGVTTADIVKIQRHILGIELLNSPYKLIAADVNKSQTITAKDISDLRRLILGITTEIPGNTSWRFINHQNVFVNPAEALKQNFDESIEINSLNGNMNLDFYAVKTGDVNESAATKGFTNTTGRNRSVMELEIDEAKLEINKEQVVEVKVSNASIYQGMQFTLQWDVHQLQLEDVSANNSLKINDDNYSTIRVAEGNMSFSWNGDMKNGDWILKLKFRSLQSGKLSEALTVNSAVTPALSLLKSNNEEGSVVLNYRGSSATDFVILQNEPNPWSHETSIGILLPQAGEVNITIYDITGKVALQQRVQMNKGYNEYLLNESSIAHAGVYYYQVDYLVNTITRKMVISK